MTLTRVKFFTGAPDSQDLQWTEASLSNGLLPAFGPRVDGGSILDTSVSSTAIAKWRYVQLDGAVFYQTPAKDYVNHLPPFSPLAPENDDFLDHSLALLDNLQSSQLTAHDPSSLDTSTTFLSTFDDTATHAPGPVPRPSGPLTTLSAIPSAAHILSIRPQTMTVNLLAAVLSLADERTVSLRRGTGTVGIIEAVLGDDTRAPFGLTLWLNPGIEGRARALRRGDVVLLERVALAVYNGVVYGQTLNRKVAGVVTRITRVDGDAGMDGRLEKVREWAGRFVAARRTAVEDEGEQTWLPEDSQ